MRASFLYSTRPLALIYVFLTILLTTLINNIFFRAPEIWTGWDIATCIFDVLLALITGYLLQAMARGKRLMKDHSYLPAIFGVLLLVFAPGLNLSMFAANFLILTGIYTLLNLGVTENPIAPLFNTGVIFATASLLYPNALYFNLLCFSASFLYGFINLRNFMAPIIGAALIYIIFFAACYSTDHTALFLQNWTEILSFEAWGNTGPALWYFVLLGLLLLVGIFDYFKHINVHVILIRKAYSVTLTHLLLGVLLIIKTGWAWEAIFLSLLPSSVITARLIQHRKSPKSRLILYGGLAAFSLLYFFTEMQ